MSRGYAAIGLHQPKTPANVGSVLRAAHCYESAMVAMTGKRYHGAPTDPQKGYRHIPLIQVENLRDAVPFDCIPVAVDLLARARPMHNYVHPERAFYIFGPEDGTLGRQITDWCRDVIYIPTAHCMNLAATVNVVLYDRMVKRGEIIMSSPLKGEALCA
jgi:tRNA(Leu) C34 or U34 (ribose-2'-O)-methylase TrmL